MSRFLTWVLAATLVQVVHVSSAFALDVELEMRPLKHRQLESKLDSGDSLTGKAVVRLRYFREQGWLFEEEVPLEIERDGDQPKQYTLKIARTAEIDAGKQVECHLMLPTTQGKWLGLVEVRTADTAGVRSKVKRLRCGLFGNLVSKMDSSSFEWPLLEGPQVVQISYAITPVDRRALAKAKDDLVVTGGHAEMSLEFFDAESEELVQQRPFRLDVQRTMRYFTNSDDAGAEALQAPEGRPLLFRMTAVTQKGKAVVAEGKVTPWRLSNFGVPTVTIDAAFRYEKSAKKMPTPGQWSKKPKPKPKPKATE